MLSLPLPSSQLSNTPPLITPVPATINPHRIDVSKIITVIIGQLHWSVGWSTKSQKSRRLFRQDLPEYIPFTFWCVTGMLCFRLLNLSTSLISYHLHGVWGLRARIDCCDLYTVHFSAKRTTGYFGTIRSLEMFRKCEFFLRI